MTPKKAEVKETPHEHVAASEVPDGGGAGTPAPEEGTPAASEAAAPADGADGATAASDPGLGVQPVADAGPVIEEPAAEPSSWDRLAQRSAS